MTRFRFIHILMLSLAACIVASCVHVPRSTDECRKILVMPPSHDDELASAEIRDLWMKASAPSLKACDEFIPPANAAKALAFLRLTHLDNVRSKHLGERHRVLAQETGATHAILLQASYQDNQAIVTAKLYALNPYSARPDEDLEQPRLLAISNRALIEPSFSRWLALKLLSAFPNSLVVGSTTSDVNGSTTKSQFKMKSRRDNTPLPPIISAISLSSAIHPSELKLFDFAPRLTGSLNTSWIDETRTYRRKTAEEMQTSFGLADSGNSLETYQLKLFLLAPSIGGEISLHTPLGTTFLGLEEGIAFYVIRDSEGLQDNSTTFVQRTVLGHRVFLTERWFLQYSAITLRSQRPIANNRFMQLFGRDYQVVGVGTFIPEVRSWIRKGF